MKLAGGDRSVNRDLEAKARALAGLKGYVTNLTNPDPDFVIGWGHPWGTPPGGGRTLAAGDGQVAQPTATIAGREVILGALTGPRQSRG